MLNVAKSVDVEISSQNCILQLNELKRKTETKFQYGGVQRIRFHRQRPPAAAAALRLVSHGELKKCSSRPLSTPMYEELSFTVSMANSSWPSSSSSSSSSNDPTFHAINSSSSSSSPSSPSSDFLARRLIRSSSPPRCGEAVGGGSFWRVLPASDLRWAGMGWLCSAV